MPLKLLSPLYFFKKAEVEVKRRKFKNTLLNLRQFK
jgi:hypothetical protein